MTALDIIPARAVPDTGNAPSSQLGVGPMRILMFAISLDLSGQSVHIRNLARGLISLGHTVAIAAGETADGRPFGREYFERAGVTVHKVDVANFNGGTKVYASQLAGACASLRSLFKAYRPHIAHVHAITLVPQTQLAAAGLRPRPAIVSTFNNEAIGHAKRTVGRLATRVSRHALGRRVLAISTAMDDMLRTQMGLPAAVIRRISYSVDDQHYVPPSPAERAAARAAFGLADGDLAIACIARLEPRKNQMTLIRAVGRLAKLGLQPRLLLAGDDIDGHRNQLAESAAAEGCAANVSFLGFQPDIRRVLWASDIHALISSAEGFGLVVVEAAMTSVPSVRSRSAGADDQIVDGRTGLLVDGQDVDAVAAAFEMLATSSERRRQMGSDAASWCRQRYSIELMARQVEAIYGEVAHV